MIDIMSVDVEDYFHVEAFSGVVPRTSWSSYPCRVEENTRRILDLLDTAGVRSTFFILGWVAERYPGLVREIVARGHEPACHSYWHRLVYTLSPEEFRDDLRRSKAVIEDGAGMAVTGYRAPSYSITARSLWALDILAEEGFTYDSSIFPIHHEFYGIADAPRHPFVVGTSSGALKEFPVSTFRWPVARKLNFPVGGGGYLRILPFWYTQLGIARVRSERLPVIVYIHPWEVDPEQPRISAPVRSRLRHYTNLRKTESRLLAVLRAGSFDSFRDSGILDQPAATAALSAAASTGETPGIHS